MKMMIKWPEGMKMMIKWPEEFNRSFLIDPNDLLVALPVDLFFFFVVTLIDRLE